MPGTSDSRRRCRVAAASPSAVATNRPVRVRSRERALRFRPNAYPRNWRSTTAEGSRIEEQLLGREVIDPHGYKIGTIDALFVHGETDVPNWARVEMGILGASSSLVPLQDAQEVGDEVRLVYEKEHVKAAPDVEPEGDELSDEEADRLHGHYGLERVMGLAAETAEDDIELPRETRDAKPPGLEEGPDSPLSKRRRQRKEEIEEVAREFEQTKERETSP